MFNITSKYFSFFNNKLPASWVVHITRDFLKCYSCFYHSFIKQGNKTDCSNNITSNEKKTELDSNFLSNLRVKNMNMLLYVLIMSRTHFRLNLHSIVAWMLRNSFLKAGVISGSLSDYNGTQTYNHWSVWLNGSVFLYEIGYEITRCSE